MPKDIAAHYYKGDGFDWGEDARLFVEAIWEANRGRTQGVYRNAVELSGLETDMTARLAAMNDAATRLRAELAQLRLS